MRHRPNHTYWKDNEHWYCGRHLPASPLPWSIEKCWLCSNKRPPLIDRPAPEEGVSPVVPQPKRKVRPRARVVPRPTAADLVGSVTTTEPPPPPKKATTVTTSTPRKVAPLAAGSGPVSICAWSECNEPARPRSKYCSRNCSNKNARARHKTRSKT